MRFLVTINAANGASAVEPGARLPADMMAFNAELIRDGVLVAADGLRGGGVRIASSGGKASVTDGPFAEAKEVIGFWILQARARDEIVERLLSCPLGDGHDLEIREIADLEDIHARRRRREGG